MNNYESNETYETKQLKDINKIIEKLGSCLECLCCCPITIYGLYLVCKNPSYKYEPILDRPTIEALVDYYI